MLRAVGTSVFHKLDHFSFWGRRMKRIMVPTDFSEHSLEALRYAVELAREQQAEVVLVHVVEPLPIGIARWYEPTKLLESYAETASRQLGRFVNLATQLYPKCRSELHFGTLHDVIGELVVKLEVDLIVMSMCGQTHLLDLLGGSTAEKILRHAPCPVLRVRTDHDVKPQHRAATTSCALT
jgi:universal stress protein A